MHKKLAADLTSLAHDILQMKDKQNVFLLKQKAHDVYEKLALLAYVEEYVNSTPGVTETKQELVEKLEIAAKLEKEIKESTTQSVMETPKTIEKVKEEIKAVVEDVKIEETPIIETKIEALKVEKINEQPFDELSELMFPKETIVEAPVKEEPIKSVEEAPIIQKKIPTLEEELKDAISLDVAVDMFEKAIPEKRSLNDRLQKTISIGLNDRIAFVKHLFGGSQEDFNRVVSQLNTFNTEQEAVKFINKTVKPDYDWSEKEEYQERLLTIIERRFS